MTPSLAKGKAFTRNHLVISLYHALALEVKGKCK